jgi:hypothetical protein
MFDDTKGVYIPLYPVLLTMDGDWTRNIFQLYAKRQINSTMFHPENRISCFRKGHVLFEFKKNLSNSNKKAMSASYINLHIDITNEDRIRMIIYDKRIDSNFPIVNILFICSIIPPAPLYVVYISLFVFHIKFP